MTVLDWFAGVAVAACLAILASQGIDPKKSSRRYWWYMGLLGLGFVLGWVAFVLLMIARNQQ